MTRRKDKNCHFWQPILAGDCQFCQVGSGNVLADFFHILFFCNVIHIFARLGTFGALGEGMKTLATTPSLLSLTLVSALLLPACAQTSQRSDETPALKQEIAKLQVQCSKSDEETCALKGEIAKLREQVAPLTKAAQESAAPHLTHALPAQEPQAALARLVKGNQAFIAGKADKSITGDARRKELLAGQHPVAAILGCADSRTPPIHLFDLGLGDGFECRNAGNIVDEPIVASLEYAVAHLGVRLIVIMSHTQCGAVKAAAANASDTPAIVSLVGRIRPAVDDAKRANAANIPERAALRNAQRQREELCARSQLLRTLSDKRDLRIVVASYDLASGQVQWTNLDGLKDPTQVAANTEAEPAKEEAKAPSKSTSKPEGKHEEKAHH